MARLIDADALKEELDAWAFRIGSANGNSSGSYGRDEALFVIDAAHTVDAVPVVRCKDCVHSGVDGYGRFCIALQGVPVKDDHFCADGERRDDEKE